MTVTVHLRAGMTDSAKAAATIAESELPKVQDSLATDSFVAFARKCWIIFNEAGKGANKLKLLTGLGVTYGGATVTKAMLTAILYFGDRFDGQAGELLQEIEFRHGREVLTGAYSKLSRLGALASSVGGPDLQPNEIIKYFLEYLRFALKFEVLQAKDITAAWLDKQKDGTPGAVVTVLGRQQVVTLVGSWVEDLRSAPQGQGLHTELARILPMFGSYEAYEKAFPTTA